MITRDYDGINEYEDMAMRSGKHLTDAVVMLEAYLHWDGERELHPITDFFRQLRTTVENVSTETELYETNENGVNVHLWSLVPYMDEIFKRKGQDIIGTTPIKRYSCGIFTESMMTTMKDVSTLLVEDDGYVAHGVYVDVNPKLYFFTVMQNLSLCVWRRREQATMPSQEEQDLAETYSNMYKVIETNREPLRASPVVRGRAIPGGDIALPRDSFVRYWGTLDEST